MSALRFGPSIVDGEGIGGMGAKSRLIGSICPGRVTPDLGEKSPGGCRIDIAPGCIHKRDGIGVVSRFRRVTCEAVFPLTESGQGQSTCAGIGGDLVNGTSRIAVRKMFNGGQSTPSLALVEICFDLGMMAG